jgi:hypothetical protein
LDSVLSGEDGAMSKPQVLGQLDAYYHRHHNFRIDRIIILAMLSIMTGIITISALRSLYISGVREGRKQMMVEVEKERARIVGAMYTVPLQEAISKDTDRIVAEVKKRLERRK